MMIEHEKLIEHLITLADSVCKIADVLYCRFDQFNYDELCMLNNVYYDVNDIKEELAKLKEGVE